MALALLRVPPVDTDRARVPRLAVAVTVLWLVVTGAFLAALQVERVRANAKVIEVVVEPGEMVFLPLGWWHQVTSLDVCSSFNFSNLAIPNRFDYVHSTISTWLLPNAPSH